MISTFRRERYVLLTHIIRIARGRMRHMVTVTSDAGLWSEREEIKSNFLMS